MSNWAENECDPSTWPVVPTDEEAARHGRALSLLARPPLRDQASHDVSRQTMQASNF